ncbi:hypothetical protein [Roseomonas sp. CECT 9278]|uniref:hypothetical protein n=1 Tax=Roseomonas sp. CECT 9278 TaxID=2845823 RepID=UPI001E3699B7|nr:hypothetical protein [Roseomonas sp. CECT 9278]CAH0250405.1 hypothetical protein ROS9278_03130 [Roseomonas sp. CECT 9278]
MDHIDPPRMAAQASGLPAPQDRLPAEPATGRALWPTFMRRTLDEHIVASATAQTPRGA